MEHRLRGAGEAGEEDQQALGEQQVPERARRTAASPDQAAEGERGDVRDEDRRERGRLVHDAAGGNDRRCGSRAGKSSREDGEIGLLQRYSERGIAQLEVQLSLLQSDPSADGRMTHGDSNPLPPVAARWFSASHRTPRLTRTLPDASTPEL